ncbi:MAG TPA: hypothetical protein PKL15_12685 [Saprospiraceae bacterium]|nr:hypothetical protein [Saprospiraceae bacterium]HNL39173.1 hypothetical protein [Saprospiraceae bacterium]HNM26286.1 hypothetical protein [Saprospiraceae bacterium]
MKTIFSFLFTLTLSFAAFAHNTPVTTDIDVVITQKRILFIADELPVKHLAVQVIDAAHHVILQQDFSSKTADWSLDVSDLPSGTYTLQVGNQAPIPFVKTEAAGAFRANL